MDEISRGICTRRVTSAGYSLLELMVAVTVLGVVLSITVPAMGDFLARSRSSTQVNELVGALHLARNEAVTRGVPVTVCPSSAPHTACSDTAVWTGGWIVFVDASGLAGTLDGSDTVLRAYQVVDAAIMTADPSSARFVRYTPAGFLASPPLAISYQPSSCTGSKGRRVAVSALGRPEVTQTPC